MSRENSEQKQVLVWNLDYIHTESGEVKILECADALNHAGYFVYEANNLSSMRGKIVHDLVNNFEKVYIFSFREQTFFSLIYEKAMQHLHKYGDQIISQSADLDLCVNKGDKIQAIRSIRELLELSALNCLVKQNSVILVDFLDAEANVKYLEAFKHFLKTFDINIPVIQSSSFYWALDDKVIFSTLEKIVPDLMPVQFVVCPENKDQILEQIISLPQEYFIFKPYTGSRGKGCLITHKSQVAEIMEVIHNADPTAIHQLNLADAEAQALEQLMHRYNNGGIEDYIIQEFVKPKPMQDSKGNSYLCSGKAVIRSIYDPRTRTTDTKLIDNYFRPANKPIQPIECEYNNQTCISDVVLNSRREMQNGDGSFPILICGEVKMPWLQASDAEMHSINSKLLEFVNTVTPHVATHSYESILKSPESITDSSIIQQHIQSFRPYRLLHSSYYSGIAITYNQRAIQLHNDLHRHDQAIFTMKKAIKIAEFITGKDEFLADSHLWLARFHISASQVELALASANIALEIYLAKGSDKKIRLTEDCIAKINQRLDKDAAYKLKCI